MWAIRMAGNLKVMKLELLMIVMSHEGYEGHEVYEGHQRRGKTAAIMKSSNCACGHRLSSTISVGTASGPCSKKNLTCEICGSCEDYQVYRGYKG